MLADFVSTRSLLQQGVFLVLGVPGGTHLNKRLAKKATKLNKSADHQIGAFSSTLHLRNIMDTDFNGNTADEELAVENKLLPAWFTERMMTDCWSFGLLMVTGDVIGIENIWKVTQDANGSLWLDATLLPGSFGEELQGHRLFTSPTSRTSVSINTAHVVAAFELANT